MDWTPATQKEQQDMLSELGLASTDAFFEAIPASLRMKDWKVPPEGMSEQELRTHLAVLAEANTPAPVSFLGGGYYDHYIPAAVDALAGRSEFFTAYTPYQPECAQGTLQAIYEYQSAVCRLADMECANASLYDGGTAVYEAAAMACRITRRNRVIVHASLHPVWKEMLETHAAGSVLQVETGDVPVEGSACLIVQNPSFIGDVRDFSDLAEECHAQGCLLVVAFNPVSLGILKTPGAMGADIAVAEGQSLGLPLGFGGPYLGILTARKSHIRKMPGRIAAATTDDRDRRGFVLTLQAREQHIRREKALSNICSNQALCALRALIHLCLLGKAGFEATAQACYAKTEYLKKQMNFLPLLNTHPTFNEFAVRLPKPATEVIEALQPRGFLPGIPLEPFGWEPGDLLIAVTEKRVRAELDAFAAAMKECCHG
ncbi:MAG TPA: aminomethyl-transferring glycine dehydrogenase subunit GcvPA [Candidatus Hydrogenedentes bacterium]|jgi:glycine dehydrogenase subunit 1|nr:MAG: putative glycine dehydrogenase (decarboxylating) subunit 1 [Candidatus Hydrogenedentes bacterium ADurb.Bin170]HOM48355.1 aminomethyl-transferring glycine dehydrogenase subunit GcvPA [Candidatus Hydrogenedentota bacterium]HPK25414.1 aminomethyl-transferring glycine dehydrogenase subunit GcvPA [Candidatus Hydrogenedentota bacterium]HPX86914.1 aminomethyl-transferring glycine dehydrogenase subunit GcvPA [Candidatus Hydrogenedentota bacterium]HQB03387.1 aminomethyl-transferring glycine dehy